MPTRDVHRMLAEQFGRGWRERFREFDDTPAAAASIGQVHRAVWHDGREVAVKVQYPGAEEALRSDLRQLARMSRLLQPLVPGQDIKPLVAELRERMEEELDYRDEAANQRAFAEVFDGDPLSRFRGSWPSAPRAMVSEWVSGRKLSRGDRGRHRGRARPRGCAARRVALLRARRGPACCTPTRIRATSSCCPTAGCWCSTSARWRGCPTGLPRPLSMMTRLALEDRPDDLIAHCGTRGSCCRGRP